MEFLTLSDDIHKKARRSQRERRREIKYD